MPTLDEYDRDTIAYLRASGVSESLIARVYVFDGCRQRAEREKARADAAEAQVAELRRLVAVNAGTLPIC